MLNGAGNGNTLYNSKNGTQEELYGESGSPENIGRIKGSCHGRTRAFTLASDNLSSTPDAVETIRHEVLGHYGVNTFRFEEKRGLIDLLVVLKKVFMRKM